MTKPAIDFGVFIGRFQPLHIGHEHVIHSALEQVKCLIILVGSANAARDPRNPFTFEERQKMIRSSFAYEMAEGRIIVEPLSDLLYSDNAWVTEVQRRVSDIVLAKGNAGGFQASGLKDFRIALTGYGKDDSSYYLRMFPEWDNVQIASQYGTFGSSDVRARFFQRIPEIAQSILSPGVAQDLEEFSLTDAFRRLLEEAEFLADYPKQWGSGPFVTADAVVIQSGHILLVERGQMPGQGLLALPGGFVNPQERIRDGAIRELSEETGISDSKGQISPAALGSFIDDSRTQIFDAPSRSLRGRIITHAFLFRLPARRKMFGVKGADDAAHAHWHRIGDLRPDMLFEDHWSIIEQMADL